jgi:hypothetical protein
MEKYQNEVYHLLNFNRLKADSELSSLLLRKGCSRMSKIPILELGSFYRTILNNSMLSLLRFLGNVMVEFTWINPFLRFREDFFRAGSWREFFLLGIHTSWLQEPKYRPPCRSYFPATTQGRCIREFRKRFSVCLGYCTRTIRSLRFWVSGWSFSIAPSNTLMLSFGVSRQLYSEEFVEQVWLAIIHVFMFIIRVQITTLKKKKIIFGSLLTNSVLLHFFSKRFAHYRVCRLLLQDKW